MAENFCDDCQTWIDGPVIIVVDYLGEVEYNLCRECFEVMMASPQECICCGDSFVELDARISMELGDNLFCANCPDPDHICGRGGAGWDTEMANVRGFDPEDEEE